MQKRFGLCNACIVDQQLQIEGTTDQTYIITEDQLYSLSHLTPKSKQLKCNTCGTLKSAQWCFTPVAIHSPEALSQAIHSYLDSVKHMSWSFGHASLMELADWLYRESRFISHKGRDYWIDSGVLYFFGSGEGFIVTFNAERISVKRLVELFLK